jgi:5-methylcytosine-specific restriction endonuclease McrA
MRNRWAITTSGEYPSDWDAIADSAKADANYTCEHCGMRFVPGTNKAVEAVNANGRPCVLTVHHLDGDKSNCAWENLLVCCQRCHLHIQGAWGPGQPLPARWATAPGWLIKRGLDYSPALQLRMF